VCGPSKDCKSCLSHSTCVYCGSDTLCYDKTNYGKCETLNTTCQPPALRQCTNPLPNARLPQGYCASIWANGVGRPRGIITASNGDLLVVESAKEQVTVFWQTNGQVQSRRLAAAPGLNHGVAWFGNFLYASSSTTVYRWKYTAGIRADLGPAEVVVKNVPCCHHLSRTLVFDESGHFYVTVGSNSNMDPNSTHARIHQFNVDNVPQGGINWDSGFLFADGLRNEVGINFDSQGRLWGVENGVDDLNRPDLGGDIHTDNPSEEINLFENPGKFYGYPYCWSEYSLPPQYSKGRGSQWVHPNFQNDMIHSDAWCRNTANVVPPRYSLGAHQAPLDIIFNKVNTFPGFPAGGAFVSMHGSWDRQPTQGYRVAYITFQNGMPTGEINVLSHAGNIANWPNNVRPVGLAFNKCGSQDCLYITSDDNGQIIEISYQG